MEKGCDSEQIHVLIREEIKADSIIPVRERKRKKVRGKYRKQLYLTFDKIKYKKRNIAETTISVLKRKFGETIRARSFRNQVKETKFKLIVYNINKNVIAIIYITWRISTEPLFQILFRYPREKSNFLSISSITGSSIHPCLINYHEPL